MFQLLLIVRHKVSSMLELDVVGLQAIVFRLTRESLVAWLLGDPVEKMVFASGARRVRSQWSRFIGRAFKLARVSIRILESLLNLRWIKSS